MSRKACARASSLRTSARTALPCFKSSSETVRPTAPTRPAAPVTSKSTFVRLGEYLGRAFWQMPAVNLYPKEAYLVKLATAGFENVRVRSIREQVFEPFARYARGRLQEPEIKQRMHPLIRAFWGSSVRDARAFDAVDYIIATADKGHR